MILLLCKGAFEGAMSASIQSFRQWADSGLLLWSDTDAAAAGAAAAAAPAAPAAAASESIQRNKLFGTFGHAFWAKRKEAEVTANAEAKAKAKEAESEDFRENKVPFDETISEAFNLTFANSPRGYSRPKFTISKPFLFVFSIPLSLRSNFGFAVRTRVTFAGPNENVERGGGGHRKNEEWKF